MKKVGILTFHSQINYGGVLQCVALQNVLSCIDNVEAFVVDRWMGPHRETLDGVFSRWRGMTQVKEIVQSCLWPRMACRQLRHLRTLIFVKKQLKLSPYSFYNWNDAPRDLGIDVIVVGSDQIWHCGDFGDPRPYLLEDAPLVKSDGTRIKAVAYAASYGIPSFPNGMAEVFRTGLKRFSRISVRERRGVELSAQVGLEATHVLDPTLLAEPNMWFEMLNDDARKKCLARQAGEFNRIVCYFITQDIEEALPWLEDFARRHNSRIDVVTTQLRPHVGTKAKLKNYCKWLLGAFPHVHSHVAAGPKEFLELFAQADSSITDSFHALMFSCVFNLNCRVLSPRNELLRLQFSRLEEFGEMIDGDYIVHDVVGALRSFDAGETITYRRDKIEDRRKFCMKWLRSAIGV